MPALAIIQENNSVEERSVEFGKSDVQLLERQSYH